MIEIKYQLRRVGGKATCYVLQPQQASIELTPQLSQSIINHSPDFEFGYGGSGPAQLALAILLDYGKRAGKATHVALRWYQEFKWVFIDTAKGNRDITGSEIETFLDEMIAKGDR